MRRAASIERRILPFQPAEEEPEVELPTELLKPELRVIDGGKSTEIMPALQIADEPINTREQPTLRLARPNEQVETQSQPETTKRSWSSLVNGVRQRYETFKKNLVERTDIALSGVADEYVERYEQSRDALTGEVPNSVLRKITRAAEAAKSSLTVRSTFEVLARGALKPLELSAQLAFKQFGIDLAVRQADYTETAKHYEQFGGEPAIQAQTLEFAKNVQAQFEQLTKLRLELPDSDAETFRQNKIKTGKDYAEGQLQQYSWLDTASKQRIVHDIEEHLDTEVYSTVDGYSAVSQDYTKQLTGIITKHVELHQKKRARNSAVGATAARWATLGTVSFVARQAMSAYASVKRNYGTELRKLPAAERGRVEKMQVFATAVKNGFLQFTGVDRLQVLSERAGKINQLVEQLPEFVQQPITAEQVNAAENWKRNTETGEDYNIYLKLYDQYKTKREAAGQPIVAEAQWLETRNVAVDDLYNEVYSRYQSRLENPAMQQWLDAYIQKHNLAADYEGLKGEKKIQYWLYNEVEDIAEQIKNRRESLSDLIKNRIENMQRLYVTQATRFAEQMYDNVKIVATLGAVASADALVENVGHVRDRISNTLSELTHHQPTIEIPTFDVNFTQHLLGLTDQHKAETTKKIEQLQPVTPEHDTGVAFDDSESGAAEIAPVVTEVVPSLHIHVVENHENLWKIAQENFVTYQHNHPDVVKTPNDVIAIIQHDNHLTGTMLHVGDKLKLEQATPVNESSVNTVESEEAIASTIDRDAYLAAAQRVDHHEPAADLMKGVGLAQLDNLPEGHYAVVLGERYYVKSSGKLDVTPVHYDNVFELIHEGEKTIVRDTQHFKSEPVTLDEFLQTHHKPIMRVFNVDSEAKQFEPEKLNQHVWSPETLAKVQFIGESDVHILDKEGAWCAQFLRQTLNKISPGLPTKLGFENVSAPMIPSAIEAAGGIKIADLNSFFTVDHDPVHPVHPHETLESTNPEYRSAVSHWLQAAVEVPMQIGTAFYQATKIEKIIAANHEHGGDANSHGFVLMGEKNSETHVRHSETVQQFLDERYGISAETLAQRGWLFETRGIEVEHAGEKTMITKTEDWQQTELAEGDTVIIHDVNVKHRYHSEYIDRTDPHHLDHKGETDRTDLLVTKLLVGEGLLLPVSVEQLNPEVVNAALAESRHEIGLSIETFVQIQPDQNLGDALQASHRAPDVLTAQLFAWEQAGFDPKHIKSGDVLPLYDEAELRTQREEIYATHEQHLTEVSGDSVHIIRPGEGIDDILHQYGFERTDYSTQEWSTIREQVGEHLRQDTAGKIALELVEVPGTAYSDPYSTTEYHIAADTVLHLNDNWLDEINWQVHEQRQAARVHLPDSLPIVTKDGVVNQHVPEHLKALINEVVDSHPEYSEQIRTALLTVGANEVMREQADKNIASKVVEEYYAVVEHGLDLLGHVPGLETRIAKMKAVYEADRDSDISFLEYLTSRQLQKDSAFAVKDLRAYSEKADIAIGEIFDWLKTASEFYASYHTRLTPAFAGIEHGIEKFENVSSAGVFQMRANNFVDRHQNPTAHAQFENQLRHDDHFNTEATASMLNDNLAIVRTAAAAFGDPLAHNQTAETVAIVAGHNGGMGKVIEGGLQRALIQLSDTYGLSLSEGVLSKATGRGSVETRAAYVDICERLIHDGKMDVTAEQVATDSALPLIELLHSPSMQALKGVYGQTVGEPMSIMPTLQTLKSSEVSYGNYAWLAREALPAILRYNEKPAVEQDDRVSSVNERLVDSSTPSPKVREL